MKTLRLMAFVLVVLFAAALPVLAQDKGQKDGKEKTVTAEQKEDNRTFAFAGAAVGAGLGAGITIIGAGLGFGKIGSAALESMARQPEVAGRVQTAMLIIAALLEGATFFALIVCIIVAGKGTF